MQSSVTQDGVAPTADVGEPWAAYDGTVRGPEVQHRPFGQGSGVLLVYSLDEARAQIAVLQGAVEQAEALFGSG